MWVVCSNPYAGTHSPTDVLHKATFLRQVNMQRSRSFSIRKLTCVVQQALGWPLKDQNHLDWSTIWYSLHCCAVIYPYQRSASWMWRHSSRTDTVIPCADGTVFNNSWPYKTSEMPPKEGRNYPRTTWLIGLGWLHGGDTLLVRFHWVCRWERW